MKLLMIDNYDSFTYNLVQYFGELGAQVEVFRNDEITVAGIAQWQPDLLEYGHAVLQPGDIQIPLLLSRDMVKELQHIDFGKGGPGAAAEAQADSIAAASEEQGDSISAAVQRALELQGQDRQRALDSIKASARRLGDSLRAVGLRQADSARREGLKAESAGSEAHRVADSAKHR